MAPKVFLSRARLRRDAPIHALARVLVPGDPAVRVATTHRLVWTLFADSAERERDFLWREAEPGLYYHGGRPVGLHPEGKRHRRTWRRAGPEGQTL